jgi:hypothetical protein
MAFEPETRVFPIARGSSSTFWFTVAVVGLSALFPLALLLVPLWPGKIELEISDAGLRIRGSMYGRLIPHPDGGSARKLSLNNEPGYSPVARTNGVGLPNYQGGWFQLQDGSKALLFMTDWSRAVVVPTSDGFTLLASPEDPDRFLNALKTPKETPGVPRNSEPLRFPLAEPKASEGSILPYLAIVSIAPAFLAVLLGSLTWASRRVRFEVSREGLRIRGPFGRRIPRDGLNIKEARIVDLRTDPTYRVSIRTYGIGMPGFGAGWFRLKGGSKGLLFVTDRTRVVAVPTNLGYTLFVSPADPEGFLAALQST